jgi:hypothetical protein
MGGALTVDQEPQTSGVMGKVGMSDIGQSLSPEQTSNLFEMVVRAAPVVGALLWGILLVTSILAYFAGRMSASAEVEVKPTFQPGAFQPRIELDASTLKIPEVPAPPAPVVYLVVPKPDGGTKVIQVPASKADVSFPDHLSIKVTNLGDLKLARETVAAKGTEAPEAPPAQVSIPTRKDVPAPTEVPKEESPDSKQKSAADRWLPPPKDAVDKK